MAGAECPARWAVALKAPSRISMNKSALFCRRNDPCEVDVPRPPGRLAGSSPARRSSRQRRSEGNGRQIRPPDCNFILTTAAFDIARTSADARWQTLGLRFTTVQNQCRSHPSRCSCRIGSAASRQRWQNGISLPQNLIGKRFVSSVTLRSTAITVRNRPSTLFCASSSGPYAGRADYERPCLSLPKYFARDRSADDRRI
jgi:hypothetical protein